MPKYIKELDGLRGFAILFVLLYHSKITIFNTPIFQGGFIGVNIFFVFRCHRLVAVDRDCQRRGTGRFGAA